jgi:hypothetical protein
MGEGLGMCHNHLEACRDVSQTLQSIISNNIGGADRDRFPIELARLISADFPVGNGSAEIY